MALPEVQRAGQGTPQEEEEKAWRGLFSCASSLVAVVAPHDQQYFYFIFFVEVLQSLV
jgi:hypothetical protein